MSRAFDKLKREARCRLCGVEGGPTGATNTGAAPYADTDGSYIVLLTRHHLVPLSDFERRRRATNWRPLRAQKNDPRNVVPLCTPCHRRVETSEDARAQLRGLLTPAEVAFVADVRGRAWLDQRYPRRRLATSARLRGDPNRS